MPSPSLRTACTCSPCTCGHFALRVVVLVVLVVAFLCAVIVARTTVVEQFAGTRSENNPYSRCVHHLHRPGYACTTSHGERLASAMNRHWKTNGRGHRYPTVHYNEPIPCAQHQTILKKRNPKMAGFSREANEQYSAVQNHLHNTKVRHCQQSTVLDVTRYNHQETLKQMRGQKVLSNASFQPNAMSAVNVPGAKSDANAKAIDRLQLQIDQMQRRGP